MFERRNTFTKILFFGAVEGSFQVTLCEGRVEGTSLAWFFECFNLVKLKLWTNSTSLKCISNLDSFKLKKSVKSGCYKLGVKDLSVLETCYDMVHSKGIKLLNRWGYIINKGSYGRMKWWKYSRRMDRTRYSNHNIYSSSPRYIDLCQGFITLLFGQWTLSCSTTNVLK